MYYIYFAKSLKNNKIYVDLTGKNPKIRVAEHNQGSNVWTSYNGPFTLVYFEKYLCKSDAILKKNFTNLDLANK